ncbi:MAG: hypothetical protein ABI836_07190 [Gemmatimonadota bacterium]
MPARLPNLRWMLLALFLVLTWGAYIRLADLGRNTLSSDEMDHYFVGQALEQNRGPVLPSGARYPRGLEYSMLVAALLPRVNPPEVAVRLPAAVIGVLALLAFAAVAWAMGGPGAGVLATLLFTIYPQAVKLSRFGRFYTLQLFAGVIALYAGWRLIRDPLEPGDLTARRLRRDWGWALLAGVAFLYATRVQVTTLSVAAGFGLFLVGVGVRDLARLGKRAWTYSVAWQLTALGGAVMIFLFVFRFGLLEGLFWRARVIPLWARLSADGGAGPITAYYRALSSHFPLLVSLLPLIFLVAIVRHPRTGALLLVWFVVPLVLHSFVFGWKSERYVLLAIPALLIAAGIAGDAAIEALGKYGARLAERYPRLRAGAVLPGLLTSIVVTAIVTQPAFNESRRMVGETHSAGWLESRRIIAADSTLRDLPLGSASPLVALHYWGRLDFTVQPALLETWTRDTTSHDINRPNVVNPVGSLDLYAGRPLLTTPASLREKFSQIGEVLIGIDRVFIDYHNIDPELVRVLEAEADELCRGRCGSMLLYRWRFRRG